MYARCIPIAEVPSKPTPRWFNSTVRHQLNRTRTVRRLTKKHPTQQLSAKLTAMEISLQALIQKSKEDYLSNLVKSFSKNPRKLYGYLNSLTQSKYKPEFIVHNGSIVHDPVEKVSLFNQFFNSTFTMSS